MVKKEVRRALIVGKQGASDARGRGNKERESRVEGGAQIREGLKDTRKLIA